MEKTREEMANEMETIKHPKDSKKDAIVAGIIRAKELHHSKDYDIAINIIVALDNAGYRVIRKPRP